MDELRCRFLGVVDGDGAGDGTVAAATAGDAETGEDEAGSVAVGDGFACVDSNGIRGGMGRFILWGVKLLEKAEAWDFEVVW